MRLGSPPGLPVSPRHHAKGGAAGRCGDRLCRPKPGLAHAAVRDHDRPAGPLGVIPISSLTTYRRATDITGLEPGSNVRLRGPVGVSNTGPVMINPAYELLD
jgi:hypothetical protein